MPTIENIHARVFEAASAPNALDMGSWHTCENTHCWGGWIVTLAGAEGKALEKFFGTPLAAKLIADASSSLPIHMPRFFEKNEAALAKMKVLADLESGKAPKAE